MIDMARLTGLVACPLLAGASPIMADEAWEAFTARCLHPQEAGALEQPADLTAIANYKNDGDTYSRYGLGDGRIGLSVSDGHGGRGKWCSVIARNDLSAETANAFLLWADEQDLSGDYASIPLRSPALLMRGRPQTPAAGMDVTMTLSETQDFIFLKATRQPATPSDQ